MQRVATAFPHQSKHLDYLTYPKPHSRFWVSPAQVVHSLPLSPWVHPSHLSLHQRLDHPGSPYLALALKAQGLS